MTPGITVRLGSARITDSSTISSHDHDHAVGGERGLLLTAEQPPDLRVAAGVGALRVHDRDVGLSGGTT